LFLTAAANYAITAAVGTNLSRYAVPGEMGLHLMFLVFLFAVVAGQRRRISR
jgi:hypothetical protein